jgi:hypothetical protein
MKRFLVVLLFILVYSPLLDGSKNSLAPAAIKTIIDRYFALTVREVEIINFGVANGLGKRAIDEVLKLGNISIAVRRSDVTEIQLKSELYQLRTSSILIFDSLPIFHRTFHSIKLITEYFESPRHLVYIPETSDRDLEVYFNVVKISTNQIDFLVNETPQSIDLVTTYLFTPVACMKPQWKVVNRFTRSENQWTNSQFFVEKFKNFHKCPAWVLNYKNDDLTEMYSALASQFNATITKLPHGAHPSQGLFRFTQAEPPQLINFHVTHIETRKIFIPPGEVYGEYEKMLLPFDTPTWIGIGVTVSLSFLGILFLKMLSRKCRELFFGRNNESPFMNFVDILINGGQDRSLAENAPRIFLMTFVLCGLIFR